MKIGVFDSGVGGQAVATAISRALPQHEIALREDREHIPYGSKLPNELISLVTPILQSMVAEGCQVIVIACNTVTTTIINLLRVQFTVPLVAIEPMVKPAAEKTKSNVIAVLATPATLSSPRYLWLKNEFAKGIEVLEPNCSEWASMIQNNEINEQKIVDTIDEVLHKQADFIVLACTHYQWIEKEIKHLAGDQAKVIEPTKAIIQQLKRVLAQQP